MDKGVLGIAGLVAGIVALLVGGLAYMSADKAMTKATQVDVALGEMASDAERSREIQKAVKQGIAEARGDLERMVAEVRAEIKRLETQAERADVVLEAKRHADENAARSAEALRTQVSALKSEMSEGDRETKAHYDELKADLEKQIKESHETLKRLVTRWLEAGVM